MASRIFVSYRRKDTAGYAHLVYTLLRNEFGAENIFMDVDTIEPGQDFVESIHRAVSLCDVLVVLIGPRWLNIQDESGARRLDDPNDFVRVEIASALKQQKRVIPALFDEAQMPGETDLPENLKPLARRQAVRIRERAAEDIERLLIKSIQQEIQAYQKAGSLPETDSRKASSEPVVQSRPVSSKAKGRQSIIVSVGIGALLLIAVTLAILLGRNNSGPPEAPHPTAENTAGASPTTLPTQPDLPSEKTQVRWFVGLGGGVGNQQIAVQQEVVADFNATQDKIELVLEVVPNIDNKSITAFLAEIASGDGPDIIGPVGLDYSNAFHDQWLDLAPYISETSFDLVSDPALRTFFQSEVGQLGLPVGVYPAAVYYVPSLFDQAGLKDPPNKYGDKYVMPDGTVVDWNWDTLTQIARLLTLDTNGRNASDTGFDRNQIVQLGFDFQWQTNVTYVACYRAGAATLVQNNSSTIPGSWKEAMQWYYDGMWGAQPFIPNGAYAASPDFGSGTPFSSGKIAMAITPLWYACCPDEYLFNNGFQFQFAALPVGDDGKVHGRVDVDTFRIWKGTQHPKEAFEVLSYLLTTGAEKLLPVYGAIPALPAQRDAFFAKKYADYPFVTRQSWDVFLQGLAYPDIPSADQNQPNWSEAHQRGEQFFYLLQSTPPGDLDFDSEWQNMIDDLNVIYSQ